MVKVGHRGEFYYKDVFIKFVTKGEVVCINACVQKSCRTLRRKHRSIDIQIYSSDRQNPKYVTDPDLKKEGNIVIQCPNFYDRGFWPSVEVSMFFGRTEIQVTAKGTNFDNYKNEMLLVKFERESIY